MIWYMDASIQLGVHPNTLRTWENKHLIEAIKTPSGQRLYNTESYINSNINLTLIDKTDLKKKNFIYARVLYVFDMYCMR